MPTVETFKRHVGAELNEEEKTERHIGLQLASICVNAQSAAAALQEVLRVLEVSVPTEVARYNAK